MVFDVLLEGCEDVRVHVQGNIIDAIVVSRDPLNDLAVIRADFTPSSVFAIDNGNPQLMQEIYVQILNGVVKMEVVQI